MKIDARCELRKLSPGQANLLIDRHLAEVEHFEERKDRAHHLRDTLHQWLTADRRIQCVKPAGAFYLFPDVSECLSSDGFKTTSDLAQALLDESRVAVTPGEAFDAPGFVRLSYATSMDNLREGSQRLLDFVAKHAPKPQPVR